MTSFSLRQVKLRPGEQYRDELEVELSAFDFGGQRYLPVPDKVPAEFEMCVHQFLPIVFFRAAQLAAACTAWAVCAPVSPNSAESARVAALISLQISATCSSFQRMVGAEALMAPITAPA